MSKIYLKFITYLYFTYIFLSGKIYFSHFIMTKTYIFHMYIFFHAGTKVGIQVTDKNATKAQWIWCFFISSFWMLVGFTWVYFFFLVFWIFFWYFNKKNYSGNDRLCSWLINTALLLIISAEHHARNFRWNVSTISHGTLPVLAVLAIFAASGVATVKFLYSC